MNTPQDLEELLKQKDIQILALAIPDLAKLHPAAAITAAEKAWERGVRIDQAGKANCKHNPDIGDEITRILEEFPYLKNNAPLAETIKAPVPVMGGYTREELRNITDPKLLLSIANANNPIGKA